MSDPRYRVKTDREGWTDSANGPKDPLSPQNKERTTRRRKDRRKWCRGKKGVEHVTEIALIEPPSWWMRYHDEDDPLCYWWKGVNVWMCRHQEVCVNCGKILQHSLGDKCPDKR